MKLNRLLNYAKAEILLTAARCLSWQSSWRQPTEMGNVDPHEVEEASS